MGWENWNDITLRGKNKLLKKTLNELRDAMIERCDVTSRTIPADVSEVISGEFDFTDWLSAFQTEMTALIPLFINNAITYGGNDTVATPWNVTTITAETEEGSRLLVPTDPLLGREWYFQQYELLNLLVWREIGADYTAGRWSTDGGSSWTNNPTYTYAFIENTAGAPGTPTRIEDVKIEFTANADHKHTTAVYVYSETLDTYYPLSPYITEDGDDLAVLMPEQALGATVTTDFLIDGYTTIPGSMPANTSNYLDYSFQGFLIAKFDSANGFEYQWSKSI